MRITCYTTQKPRVLIAKSSTSGKIDNDTMHNRAIHQGQVNNFCEEPQETEESVWDPTRVITAEKCRHELTVWIAIPYGGYQSPVDVRGNQWVTWHGETVARRLGGLRAGHLLLLTHRAAE